MHYSKEGHERGMAKILKRTPERPKFEPGARIGDLKITHIIGHLPIKGSQSDRPQSSWHYRIKCLVPTTLGPCGRKQTMHQKQLAGERPRTKCDECTKRHKAASRVKYDTKRGQRLQAGSAFLRMPKPSLVGGPDQ